MFASTAVGSSRKSVAIIHHQEGGQWRSRRFDLEVSGLDRKTEVVCPIFWKDRCRGEDKAGKGEIIRLKH